VLARATGAGEHAVCLDCRSDAARVPGADFRDGVLPAGVTFSRASGGTYFNSSGTLIEVATNVPRFDHALNGAPLGLLIEPSTTNLAPNPRGEGAVAGVLGSGGALPTNWGMHSVVTGLTTEVVTPNAEQFGIPGIVLRVFGTATATGNHVIRTGGAITSTGVATITFSAYLRREASVGSTPQTRWHIGNQNALGSLIDPVPSINELVIGSRTVTFASSVNRMTCLWLAVDSGDAIDETFFVGAPQMAAENAPSSRIFPPPGSPAASTRAAETVTLAVANGTYDVLVQDTAGGEWRAGEVVTGGSYTITPRSGQRHVRRVRLYAPGTAAANPGWAVAA
jgi:hypothetical protein